MGVKKEGEKRKTGASDGGMIKRENKETRYAIVKRSSKDGSSKIKEGNKNKNIIKLDRSLSGPLVVPSAFFVLHTDNAIRYCIRKDAGYPAGCEHAIHGM